MTLDGNPIAYTILTIVGLGVIAKYVRDRAKGKADCRYIAAHYRPQIAEAA